MSKMQEPVLEHTKKNGDESKKMKCRKCQKEIVSYPCPDCGHDDSIQKDAVEGGTRR